MPTSHDACVPHGMHAQQTAIRTHAATALQTAGYDCCWAFAHHSPPPPTALGYKSVIVPLFILSFIVFAAHTIAGFYGIALSALGMLSTLATCLAIDVYGPVCDNAGAVHTSQRRLFAEM